MKISNNDIFIKGCSTLMSLETLDLSLIYKLDFFGLYVLVTSVW